MVVTQLCPTLCDPMDYRPPASSVHGILQERIVEWVAIPFYRRSSPPRHQTQVSHIADRFFIIWTTRLNPDASLLLKGQWDRCVLQNLAFKSQIIQFINFWNISGRIKEKSWNFTSRVTFQLLTKGKKGEKEKIKKKYHKQRA